MSDTIVEPVELWCWDCIVCCTTNVMETVATTQDVTSVKESCRKCGAENEIRLPE